ncbi:MAG TPA: ABC transporter permease [Chthoniobacterales bacterium]
MSSPKTAGEMPSTETHEPTRPAPASAPQAPQPPASPVKDERMTESRWFTKLLKKPEFASIAGAVLVFAVFGVTAGDSGMFQADGVVNWMQVSAYLGILAIGAALLMIAGEFDLSIGSMIGFAGMMVALPALYFDVPLWATILLAFAGSMALGAVNGWLVVKTKLPSFIVTLAFLFILRGLTLALSIMFANRTVVSGVGDLVAKDWFAQTFFAGTTLGWLTNWLASIHVIGSLADGTPIVPGVPKVIVWWGVLAVLGAFVLVKTRFGNWIFSVGGDANASRNVGVPVKRVKISLFVLTAFCACLFAVLQVCDIGSAAADRGLQKEFEAVIAAVIGGCLLTGGHGSVIGACFGALIFGVVQIGITYTNVSSDWFRVFLGVMLLIAVLFNNFIRNKVAQSK